MRVAKLFPIILLSDEEFNPNLPFRTKFFFFLELDNIIARYTSSLKQLASLAMEYLA